MTIPNKVLKALPNDLIDELLTGYQKPEDLIGENGLLKQLTKALVEWVFSLRKECLSNENRRLHKIQDTPASAYSSVQLLHAPICNPKSNH
jgi:hypothetical protein